MSIERDRWGFEGEITFECDGSGCNAEIHTETADFDSAVTILRGAGWQSKKIGHDWLYLCPEHREDAPRARGGAAEQGRML